MRIHVYMYMYIWVDTILTIMGLKSLYTFNFMPGIGLPGQSWVLCF